MATITGDNNNNNLMGTALDDYISGLGGNDTLSGGNGNDTLDGGTGNDSMIGGNGNDVYFVDSIFDRVVETSASGGIDTVFSSLSNYVLGNYVENLTLIGNATQGGGNFLDNVITGNDLDNQLGGGLGSGNDTLIGGLGNDQLTGGFGSDVYAFSKGDGSDIIYESSDSTYIDKVQFDGTIAQSDVAIFQDGDNLQIGYIGSSDLITVDKQFTTGQVEQFALDNGSYLSNVDINQIIQDMAAYATEHSISLTSLNDVKNDAGLMAIVNGAWHT